MKIFKVLGNTLAAVGNTIQNSAELVNEFVGEDGLKHSTRQSFKIINISLDQSVEMALLESQEELKQFRKDHNIKEPEQSATT